MAEQARFVRVSEDKTHLVLNDKPFPFCGANCYYLMTRAAPTEDWQPSSTLQDCIRVLDNCQANGINVIRTWAFNDQEGGWNTLQTAPGVYDERVIQGLDWVVAEAAKRDIKLILCLINYWDDGYDGMKQYCKWSMQQHSGSSIDTSIDTATTEVDIDDFYSDEYCQDLYRKFITAVITRRNTITGVLYRDEKHILGWSVANEPRRYNKQPTNVHTASVLGNWIHSTAAFIKSLDTNHLVMVDTEGFIGTSTPEHLSKNPFSQCTFHNDFYVENKSEHIDVACCHLYPDHWLPKRTEKYPESSMEVLERSDRDWEFSYEWIMCHLDISRHHLKKPLLLTEFGYREQETRAEFFSQIYSQYEFGVVMQNGFSGTCFWTMAAPGYEDYDGFTVYFAKQQAEEDRKTCSAIRHHVGRVKANISL